MHTVAVDDPGDARLDEYRDLTDAELRRVREASAAPHGIFIAEGALVLHQLVDSGLTIRSVLLTPRRLEDLAGVLAPLDVPVFVVEQRILNQIGGFNIHRGVLAAAERPAPRAWQEVVTNGRRVVLLEDINDQENLGALFRNAAALGMDAVLLSPRCADPLYRRTVRVSIGHVLRVPFARLEPWPAAIGELAARFRLVALAPTGEATVDDVAIALGDDRAVVALGAEGPGLSGDVLERAWTRARIPMRAGTDSLNVAAASAIAFHHLGHLPARDRDGIGEAPAGIPTAGAPIERS